MEAAGIPSLRSEPPLAGFWAAEPNPEVDGWAPWGASGSLGPESKPSAVSPAPASLLQLQLLFAAALGVAHTSS